MRQKNQLATGIAGVMLLVVGLSVVGFVILAIVQ